MKERFFICIVFQHSIYTLLKRLESQPRNGYATQEEAEQVIMDGKLDWWLTQKQEFVIQKVYSNNFDFSADEKGEG